MLVVLCGLATAVTIMLINISNRSTDGRRQFTIAVGGDFGAQEMLLQNGPVVGFHMDLIEKVCEEAEIRCQTVYEPYANCWDTIAGEEPRGGMGLLGKWYDACAGWAETPERVRVFNFTKPFMKSRRSYFYELKSANHSGAAPTTRGFKIGFLVGWSSDSHCLDHNGIKIPDDAQDDSQNSKELADKLLKHQIDLAFLVEGILNLTSFKPQMSGYECDKEGSAMMATKTSEFAVYWNKGFDRVKQTDVYEKLCEKWDLVEFCLTGNE